MKASKITPLFMSFLIGVGSVAAPVQAADTVVVAEAEDATSEEAVEANEDAESASEAMETEAFAQSVAVNYSESVESETPTCNTEAIPPETSEVSEVTEAVENTETTSDNGNTPEIISEENTQTTEDTNIGSNLIPPTIEDNATENTTPDTDIDNDELYEDYLNSILYATGTSQGVQMYQDDTGKTTLSSSEYKIYQALREYLAKVANGEETSTSFSLDFASLGLQTEFTKEELGLDSIISNNSFTSEAKAAFSSKISEMFNLTNVVRCMLQDAPYDLYWYDKTKGASFNYSYSAGAVWDDTTNSWDYSTMVLKSVTFKFYVAPGYNADTTYLATDATGITKAKTAVTNAQAIVSDNASKSDYEKVLAYKDKIMDLASYDSSAANAGTFSTYGSSNPWQLIWVFDGDTSTNVVCEGYSKAFQYLCELSSFNSDIYCYSVTGTMNGGGHMWNIIKMDDDNYYLVDVTNSDTGTIGQRGGLFLNGATAGDASTGYIMDCNGTSVFYAYDSSTIANNLSETLNISMSDYEESKIAENHISFDWNYANSGFVGDVTFSADKANLMPANNYKRTGYVFKGWNTKMDGTGDSYDEDTYYAGLIDTRNENVRLYAQWEKDTTYKVSFDWNYGNAGSMPVLTGYTNDRLQLPANTFTKTDATFIGWNTKIDGTGKSYSDEAVLTGLTKDIVLYAQWQETPKISVSFDWNYGNLGSMPNITIKKNESATLPTNTFKRIGHIFNGWNTKMDGTGTSIGYDVHDIYKALDGKDTILYAQWKEDAAYSVSYDWNYGNSGSMAVSVGYEHDGATISSNGFVKDGYTFKSWNTKMDGSGKEYKAGDKISDGQTKNIVLYAQWEKTV